MNIDWYKVYTEKKKLSYNKKIFKKNLKIDRPYVALIKKYIGSKGKILECGCGPAKTAISISNSGFEVTAIDHNKNILNLAKRNAKIAEVGIKFKLIDFFNIDKEFEKDFFGCITHQGVIEHFPKNEIKKIIRKQLKIVPFIIFSIPIDTKFNLIRYSQDNVYRNLWSKNRWVNDILKDFNVVETKIIGQRSDNLLVVIKRK
jgi:2-polyprenyl-3-methyl-5-hydroxy-6-metoxy-1,4-benzoquinol methylase